MLEGFIEILLGAMAMGISYSRGRIAASGDKALNKEFTMLVIIICLGIDRFFDKGLRVFFALAELS